MVEQGTTRDILLLIKSIADSGENFVPDNQMLLLIDPVNSYNRAIGILIDVPRGGFTNVSPTG